MKVAGLIGGVILVAAAAGCQQLPSGSLVYSPPRGPVAYAPPPPVVYAPPPPPGPCYFQPGPFGPERICPAPIF